MKTEAIGEERFLEIRTAAEHVLHEIENPQRLIQPVRRLHAILRGNGAAGKAVEKLHHILEVHDRKQVMSSVWVQEYLKALGEVSEVLYPYVHQGGIGG